MSPVLAPERPARRPGQETAGTRWLCWSLATAVSGGGALTVLVPTALQGVAAMNGSARGTALAMVAFGVPTLLTATARSKVSTTVTAARAGLVRLGAVAFLVYNSVMLLFGTPFNAWFLIYVLMLGLSLALLIMLCTRIDAVAIGQRFTSTAAAHALAACLMLIVVANLLIWLRVVIPALAHTDDPEFLKGTGLITNPIYVQDLSFWLPLAGLGAIWLWTRRPWGVVLAGGFLSMWALESLCVGLDQWFGSRADPQSSVVSSSMVVPFVLFAGVCVGVLVVLLSRIGEGPGRAIQSSVT